MSGRLATSAKREALLAKFVARVRRGVRRVGVACCWSGCGYMEGKTKRIKQWIRTDNG